MEVFDENGEVEFKLENRFSPFSRVRYSFWWKSEKIFSILAKGNFLNKYLAVIYNEEEIVKIYVKPFGYKIVTNDEVQVDFNIDKPLGFTAKLLLQSSSNLKLDIIHEHQDLALESPTTDLDKSIICAVAIVLHHHCSKK